MTGRDGPAFLVGEVSAALGGPALEVRLPGGAISKATACAPTAAASSAMRTWRFTYFEWVFEKLMHHSTARKEHMAAGMRLTPCISLCIPRAVSSGHKLKWFVHRAAVAVRIADLSISGTDS